MRRRIPGTLLLALGAAAGVAASADAQVVFTDATASAGIRFKHNSGAFGKKYLPETMGAGAAWLDFDGDGWPDILLANSKSWPGRPGPSSRPALYRNNQNGTFSDATRGSGLDVEMYGLGVAAADYDNDGKVDAYLRSEERRVGKSV